MIGVIADDLSGAAEIGAIGLRHHLRAEILLQGRPDGAADLVCVDTDSRSCAPDEAARRAAAATRMLRKAGAEWIYKKVDSVLRGNVLAEILAISGTGVAPAPRRVLLHPANPSLGRVIRDGKYFVCGKLIHKTEFARDPAFPRRTADVRALLNGTATAEVCFGILAGKLPLTGIVICESASARDVQHWARRADGAALLAGGAEFFAALLIARGARTALSAETGKHARKLAIRADSAVCAPRELFVCGSTSEASKQFVSAARRAGTAVFSLPREVAWGVDFTRVAAKAVSGKIARAFESESRVILRIGLRTVRDAAVARKLSDYLTQLAEAVLHRVAVSRVYAEGGATAVELARRMGWTRMEVVREIAPGVATLSVSGGESLEVTVKPGTYIWPEEIQKLPAALK